MNGMKISCTVLGLLLLVSLAVIAYLVWKANNRPVIGPEKCDWNATTKQMLGDQLVKQKGVDNKKAGCVVGNVISSMSPCDWVKGNKTSQDAMKKALSVCESSV